MEKLTIDELKAGIEAKEKRIFFIRMADFPTQAEKDEEAQLTKEINEMKKRLEEMEKPAPKKSKAKAEPEPEPVKLNVFQKLAKVQSEIKAPKNLFNKFGGYNYRNAEGIVNAFKEYESKYNVALLLSDNINLVGERYYIEATATFIDIDTGDTIKVSASAREAETKKGMDDSQISGTASSYARKYALNGLLLLDDTKDADSDEYHKQIGDKPEKATEAQRSTIKSICNENRVNLETWLSQLGTSWDDLDKATAGNMLNSLKAKYKSA